MKGFIERVSYGCKVLLRLTLVATLFLHFSIVALDLLPDNPIKHQYKRELLYYMNPLFAQSWNLFAPNPVNFDTAILLQFKKMKKGNENTTAWVDIIEPLLEIRRQSFWSPTQRVLKNMSSITQSIAETNNNIRIYIQKTDSLKNKDVVIDKIYSRLYPTSPGHIALIQYSKYVYKNMNETADFDSVLVRYRIVYQEYPRFSKRKQDYNDKKNWVVL